MQNESNLKTIPAIPCRIDKDQIPCKICGEYGCVYKVGTLYFAQCGHHDCDLPGRHMHDTKRAAIAEWNEINKVE